MSTPRNSSAPGASSTDQELEPPRTPTLNQLLVRIWHDWLEFLMTGR